jgi:Synergist-CTERM protein sorting domain-containing protein
MMLKKNWFLWVFVLFWGFIFVGDANAAKEAAGPPPETKWEKSFGGSGDDYVNAIQQTTDGGYVVVGYSYYKNDDRAHADNDGWFVRLDASGNPIAGGGKLIGGSGNDTFYSVQPAGSGYIAVGESYSNDKDTVYGDNHGGSDGWSGSDGWIVRFDASGNPIAGGEKLIGGSGNDHLKSIQPTSDGGYIAVGQSFSNDDGTVYAGNHGYSDGWIVRLDASGKPITGGEKLLGGSNAEGFNSIQPTSDGGHVIVGWTHSQDGDLANIKTGTVGECWIVKLAPNGEIEWQKTIALSSSSWSEFIGYCIQETADGDYVIAGTDAYGGWYVWHVILKLDAQTKEVLWEKLFRHASFSGPASMRITPDGGYVVSGRTGYSWMKDQRSEHWGWIYKLDADGEMLWETYPQFLYKNATDIQLTPDGGYIAVGNITDTENKTESGNSNGWIVKLGPDGSGAVGDLKVDVFGGVIEGINNDSYRGRAKLSAISTTLIDEFYMSALPGNKMSALPKNDPYRRDGFTADGNSRLLVRFQSNAPLTIKLDLAELARLGITAQTLDRKPVQSNITLNTLANAKYQKTIVLIAPETWRGEAAKPSVPFSIKVNGVARRDLVLAKTPVVLVHGWNGSAKGTFGGISWSHGVHRKLHDAGFIVHAADYPNTEGPSRLENEEKVKQFYKDFIAPAMQKATESGLECSRVDIVAHSMGGLMAKAFTFTSCYKTDASYGERIIRRLITLGTPHWGSGFASYVCADSTYLDLHELDNVWGKLSSWSEIDPKFYRASMTDAEWTWYQVLCALNTNLKLGIFGWEILDERDKFGDGSAFWDMRMHSGKIEELNSANYEVPMYLIAGDYGEHLEFGPWLGFIAATGNLLDPLHPLDPYKHQDLFRDVLTGEAERSDGGAVGLSSARWKRASGVFPSSEAIKGLRHTDMGSNSTTVNNRVVELLEGELKFFHAQSGSLVKISSRAASRGNFEQRNMRIPNVTFPERPEKITLTAEALEVQPGEIVKFSAGAESEIEDAIFTGVNFDFDEENVKINAEELKGEIKISPSYSGVSALVVNGTVDGEPVKSNTLIIVVKPDLSKLSSIEFSKGSQVTYFEGANFSLGVTGTFIDGKMFDISRHELGTQYTTSNPSVAKVSVDGEVEAITPGEVTLTATNKNREAIMRLTVVPFDVKPLNNLEPVTPSDPTNPPTAPDDPSNPGDPSAPVNPPTPDNPNAPTTPIAPTGIGFADAAGGFTLSVGGEKLLIVELSPANATETSLTWNTSDPKVVTVTPTAAASGAKVRAASVKQGAKVKAVGEGTATITARTSNGLTVGCAVTVTAPNADEPFTFTLDLSDLNLRGNVLRLKPGDEVDATISSNPAGAKFKAVGVPEGLTLASDGRLRGVAATEGTYPVTVEGSLNGVTKVFSFTIEIEGAVVAPVEVGGKGNGGGGCNAGLSVGMALAAIALALREKRR